MFKVRQKFFAKYTALMFLAVVLEHGYRVYAGFDIHYGDVLIPLWMSGLITVLAVLFMTAAFRQK